MGDTYDRRGIPLVLQISTAKHRQRTAETMSRDNERVARVLLLRGINLTLQSCRDGLVIVPETLVHFATAA